MKKLVCISFLLFAVLSASGQGHVTRAMEAARQRQEQDAMAALAREQAAAMDRSGLMMYMVENGDTTFLDVIEPTWCFGRGHGRRKEWRKYYRLVYNFAKVYPFALASSDLQHMVDSTIAAENMSVMKRDRYISDVQGTLFKGFEKPLRKMTITQGGLLLKLIDRETGQSSYSIIKQYKNGVAAGFWQGIAMLFDNNLKAEYDPKGEDKDLEELVQHWHAGTFKDLYYGIFFEDPPEVKVPDFRHSK